MAWSFGEWDRMWDHAPPGSIEGVDIQFVCGGIPVLNLDKISVFNEYASMLLQTALNSFEKADSLFEDCVDPDVMRGCGALGLQSDDVHLARLKRLDLKAVRAAGTTKRSVMFALVLALTLQKDFQSRALWEALRSYGLFGPFAELLDAGREAMQPRPRKGGAEGDRWIATATAAPPGGRSPSPSPACGRDGPPVDGVKVSVVCGQVPVITLDRGNRLEENASWLLQTATSSDGKAGALYEYCRDDEIMNGCRTLGLSNQEAFIARLTPKAFRDVMAVGATGKRSVMLGLVIALLLQRRVPVAQLRAAVDGYDAGLWAPLEAILQRATGGSDFPPDAAPAAKRPRLAAMNSPTPEERWARAERARRFEAGGTCSGHADAAALPRPDVEPIKGSCEEVERPLIRSAGVRRASEVRPPHVLRQAFGLVRERWAEGRDWVRASEALGAIRQELAVQAARGALAVEVCEFSARAALESGDLKRFELCSAQLEELYGEPGGARGGAPPPAEFLAYRLLWLTLRGERLALAAFRRCRARELRARRGDPQLALAAAFCAALERGHLLRACSLALGPPQALPAPPCPGVGEAAGSALRRLLAELLERRGARLSVLAAACRAAQKDRPPALLALVRRLLAPTCAPGPAADEALRGLPLALVEGDPTGIDWRATAEDAERLLVGVSAGWRRQLGEQRDDHMRGFVRA